MNLLAPFRAPGTAAVHQVGVIVADLERAIAGHARLLGFDDAAWRRASFDQESVLELTLRGEPAAFSIRLAFAGNDPEIELIEPVAGSSIYHEWLEERGEGLHHIAVVVNSLVAATAAMEASDFAVLQAGRGFQPEGTGGFAYYDTAQVLGYVLEAVELP
ncbi:MAG TPA: VOC family protein [Gaiellaceae bacterium]